jgi:hypothetical protein
MIHGAGARRSVSAGRLRGEDAVGQASLPPLAAPRAQDGAVEEQGDERGDGERAGSLGPSTAQRTTWSLQAHDLGGPGVCDRRDVRVTVYPPVPRSLRHLPTPPEPELPPLGQWQDDPASTGRHRRILSLARAWRLTRRGGLL